ncbi:SDR family NAD(P)-dependent oxidoreductase [Hymenobacter taeanensis]|uniref:SDR family NAD(P)-dependent oxidoreductase n=1 Tax=Hymenobacter taeanensis TaxID=2735321 RepID=A0A6M6BJ45_9BACT|nr:MULTISPECIES: SDR family NAD(P)-dependent oxidoreductase [Hymenobacter]QJX48052.1 SDR family NAD(P)-dependent oxidoreductase [Hymenobacter taeanensis]UOQ82498.1 SDR family NAD(P)-dependent oxidoreductase [Hymenobacter sp. 5414T-23]
MNLSNNTILITGGATGIGLALTERFLKVGSKVIVCGRRAEALEQAQRRLPGLHTRVCDVARPEEREDLARWVQQEFPGLNVLINNAGIQNRWQLAAPDTSSNWADYQNELAINVEAPMHLALLLIPHLRQQQHPAIINVTSGLSFAPAAFAPIYSATKAAMHSFTLSLRHQLASTPIRVLEIVPPAVNTDLGGPGLHTFGAPVDAFADSVLERLAQGEQEVGYGTSEEARLASREQLNTRFKLINK